LACEASVTGKRRIDSVGIVTCVVGAVTSVEHVGQWNHSNVRVGIIVFIIVLRLHTFVAVMVVVFCSRL
jgi:hypothetical protein